MLVSLKLFVELTKAQGKPSWNPYRIARFALQSVYKSTRDITNFIRIYNALQCQ
jgi:hypothetical protein